MVEAQKAYQRLEKDYLENHFKHLDEGCDERAVEGDAAKIKQSLNKGNLGG